MTETKPIGLREKGIFSQAQMKYIVIILMVLDHLAHILGEDFPLYLPFRLISRLTGPVMAFFIAEGYVYTHDVKKYLKRLFVFSLVSWLPYCYFCYRTFLPVQLLSGHVVDADRLLSYSYYLSFIDKTLTFSETSVITTLFFGLLALVLWDKAKIHWSLKALATAAIFFVSMYGDWWAIDVMLCLCFYFLRNRKVLMWTVYAAISCVYIFGLLDAVFPMLDGAALHLYPYRLGALLVIPFVAYCYTGKLGKKCAFNKWFFYIFYPGHLLILALINFYVLGN